MDVAAVIRGNRTALSNAHLALGTFTTMSDVAELLRRPNIPEANLRSVHHVLDRAGDRAWTAERDIEEALAATNEALDQLAESEEQQHRKRGRLSIGTLVLHCSISLCLLAAGYELGCADMEDRMAFNASTVKGQIAAVRMAELEAEFDRVERLPR